MRSRPSNVLMGLAVVAMLACDEGPRITDPVPSAVVDPAPATPEVRIRGPEAVQTPGEYEWHAWT